MYKKIHITLLLSCILTLGSLDAKEPSITASMKKEQTTIKTVDGSSIKVTLLPKGLHFKGYEKKIVLLEFFGHSCPPCRAAIPGYNRLQKKYADDVTVIAIESWGLQKEKLQRFVEQMGIDYKVAATTDAGKMFKFVGKLTGWAPKYGVPFLILFAPGGKLVKYLPPGKFDESYVEKSISQIRGE